MIHLHLVVQRQGVVTVAPVVADPLVFLKNKRVHVELPQSGGNRKSGLSGPDDDNGGTSFFIADVDVSEVAPVRPFKVA